MKLIDRVRAGAAFLDAVYGRKWRKKIDLESLALASGTACVLGQTDGDYSEHVNKLDLSEQAAIHMGFQLPDDDGNGTDRSKWYRLTQTWKRYLKERAN